MSIRARLDDSTALHKSGRYEGAILSLLVAVAATSRKRYPEGTMGDGAAFRKFLGSEMKTITGNIENLNIKFRGVVQPLQDVLYKFVRCGLFHEGEMPTDFIVERGATLKITIEDDIATFSDALLDGIARAVILAPENADEFKDIINQLNTAKKQSEEALSNRTTENKSERITPTLPRVPFRPDGSRSDPADRGAGGDQRLARMPEHLNSLQRLLDEALTLELVAERLHIVDSGAESEIVAADLKAKNYDECGVNRDGVIVGFVRVSELNSGTAGDCCHEIPAERLAKLTDPLWLTLEALSQRGSLYVSGESGRLEWLVTIADLNKQPARLLMFGIISMLEMVLLELIRAYCKNDSWRSCITRRRVRKAEGLQRLLIKRNEEIGLIDCLQLCDKAKVCLRTPAIQSGWDRSPKEGKKLFKDLEGVRNKLAHARSPASNGDWSKVFTALRDGHQILELSANLLVESETKGDG